MSQPSREKSAAAARPESPESWGWTRRQRIGLGILLAILAVFLVAEYVWRPARLDAPATQVEGQPLLPQFIDPNTASAPELARVPHLGDALAAKIVAYRQERQGMTSDGIVFRQADDLATIPGIGSRLSAEFAPFFKFPELDATATRP